MALVKCPECGRVVSDRAKVCIHCGYPLQDEKQEQLYIVTLESFNYEGKLKERRNCIHSCINFLSDTCMIPRQESYSVVEHLPYVISDGLTKENADYITRNLSQLYYIASAKPSKTKVKSSLNDDIHRKIYNLEEPLRCPRCRTTSVITGQRGFSMITGFIGSNKTMNRCSKCGYTWYPSIK